MVELRRAGYLRPTAIRVFLAVRNGAVILALILTGLIAIWVGPSRRDIALRVIVGGVAIAGLRWGLPRLVIRSRGRQRVERISRALPFALDMTVMCLSGGLTLRDALAHVTSEVGLTHRDLATELAIIQRQADMTSMESAFRQFAVRIDSPEVAAMVALIIQNEQLGTNIADSIRNYAEAIRLKWRQNADERAGRVVIYMLFPMAFFLLPAIFLMLGGPAILEMVNFFKTTVPSLDFEARHRHRQTNRRGWSELPEGGSSQKTVSLHGASPMPLSSSAR